MRSAPPLDIAPTLIQAAGAKWNNDQYGIGISFWSEDSSLAEKIGLTSLEKALIQQSNMYSNVFWAPPSEKTLLENAMN